MNSQNVIRQIACNRFKPDSLRSLLFFVISSIGIIFLLAQPVTAATPTVNGLFYGDGDNEIYSLVDTSYYGSGLYGYYDVETTDLYVALVVDRSVNDNVFGDSQSDYSGNYMVSAGWGGGGGQQRGADKLSDSEFATFTFACDLSPTSPQWTWSQGYACESGSTWVSDSSCSKSVGPYPPNLLSASSFAWNINNYVANALYPWDMYFFDSRIRDWKSPFSASDPNTAPPNNPNTVIGLEGYPAPTDSGDLSLGPKIMYNSSYQWEWAMVYEWKIRLSDCGCGSNALYLLGGATHHSPMKAGAEGLYDTECGEENDCFPPPEVGVDPPTLADWGDLPDSYGTTANNNGATHELRLTSPYLGQSLQFEEDGVATGDTSGDGDEEDGISFVDGQVWQPGANVGITATVGGNNGYLVGWFDWDGDGSFSSDEKVEFGSVSDGTNALSTTIPSDANPPSGLIYMRFRLYDTNFTPASYDPTGSAVGGEVEDYNKAFVATRVTISSFFAYTKGNDVLVEWETVSEHGTVGFYLYRLNNRNDKYQKLNGNILPGLLFSPSGGRYIYRDSSAESGMSYTYKLEEVEHDGTVNTYGPWTVYTGALTFEDDPIDEELFQSAGSGFKRAVKPLSQKELARIASKQVAKIEAQALKQARKGALIKIAVSEDGLYYIKSDEVAQVMGITDKQVTKLIKTGRIRLRNQDQLVAVHPTPDNMGFYFYGEKFQSRYTNENIYWLDIHGGLQMQEIAHAPKKPVEDLQYFQQWVWEEEDNYPLTALFTDPEDDFWMWDFIFTGYVDKAALTVSTPGCTAGADDTATLSIALQGATDGFDGNDHHALIYVNGVNVGDARWDGLDSNIVSLPVATALLNDGDNTVEITGVKEAGVPYSIFYVNNLQVIYPRCYTSVDNQLTAENKGYRTMRCDGFWDSDIRVFDITNPKRPVVLTRTVIKPSASGKGDFQVSFSSGNLTSCYLATTPENIKRCILIADEPSDLKNKSNKGDYLIITSSDLVAAAQGLADYRASQGHVTKVVDVENIYDEFSYGNTDPQAIRAFLAYAHKKWRIPPKYVLLAGEGSYDYKNNRGFGDSVIPALLTGTPDGLFVTDMAYADVDGEDSIPEFAVGRIPVINSDEMLNYTDKVIGYETSFGVWTQKGIFAADLPDAGGDFISSSEELAGLFPKDYLLDKLYLDVMPQATARLNLAAAINEGRAYVNFFGHGGPTLIGNKRLFSTNDLGDLSNGYQLPVFTAMTCLSGSFGFPGLDGLGEALILKTGGGAIAMWAPSGLAYNENSMALCKGFYNALFIGGETVLGDVIRRSKENYADQGYELYHLDLYNLLGDPALRLK